MNNNDLLIELKNSLDLNHEEMLEIFTLSGITMSKDKLNLYLKNSKAYQQSQETEAIVRCDFNTLESFLNGFIIFKRGPKENGGEVIKTMNLRNANNLVLKKIKIALEMSSEDVLKVINLNHDRMTKGELTTYFRKEDHKHYKKCNDKLMGAFLEGLKNK